MKESTIERAFARRVKKAGGLCWKFTSPGTQGVPDRVVILPQGRVFFVELKSENGRLSAIQETRLKELSERGTSAWVCRGNVGIEEFFQYAGI